jgi:hypothetical protein
LEESLTSICMKIGMIHPEDGAAGSSGLSVNFYQITGVVKNSNLFSLELFHYPNLMHNSLFINNIYVTLLCSKHVEDNSVTYMLLMSRELCIKVG